MLAAAVAPTALRVGHLRSIVAVSRPDESWLAFGAWRMGDWCVVELLGARASFGMSRISAVLSPVLRHPIALEHDLSTTPMSTAHCIYALSGQRLQWLVALLHPARRLAGSSILHWTLVIGHCDVAGGVWSECHEWPRHTDAADRRETV